MNKNLCLILGGAILFLLIAACVIPGQAIPSAPTIDQNLVQTSIAGTVQVAQTQTAAVQVAGTEPPAGMTGTAIEQAQDGITKYIDYDGGFEIVFPAGWLALRPNSEEFNDALANEATVNSMLNGAPIVYATALSRGMTPASMVMDSPVVYDNFRPENYGRKFLGSLTLTEALARSVNNAAVHLLEDVGIEPTIAMARRLGIRSQLEPGLALALGASSVSRLELTRAYATLGAGARQLEPRMLLRVRDREGQVLLENVPLDEQATGRSAAEVAPGDAEAGGAGAPSLPEGYALAPAEAFVATSLLRAPIEHPAGTGRAAAALGRPLAGKTGTTNDHTDAWFVGFSPEIATGVWVGFDQNRLLGKGETGGRAALPIWMDFMRPLMPHNIS